MDTIKPPINANKALWEKGDFTQIAQTMRESGAELVSKIGITKGLRVLDLGCGDGTTAIPEAELGAVVLGVDIAANLVEAGNIRAKAAGLTNLKFQEGDATNLVDLNDQSFDLVVSIFGAMFAPKPYDVAKEMVRVTRRGGKIVMGNWIPGDPRSVLLTRLRHPKVLLVLCCGVWKTRWSTVLEKPVCQKKIFRSPGTHSVLMRRIHPAHSSMHSAIIMVLP